MKLLGYISVERHTVNLDPITDRRDAVLKLERFLTGTIRLQEIPQRLSETAIADAACLHFRRPRRPILDVGPGLGDAEAYAPGFEAIPTAQFPKLRIPHSRGLIVEIGDVRQDQPAGDERVDDDAVEFRAPTMQPLEQWKIITLNVVTDQVVGAR